MHLHLNQVTHLYTCFALCVTTLLYNKSIALISHLQYYSLMDPVIDKWYFKNRFVVFAFLCAGPLALPLIWFHPRYSQNFKIITTAIIAIASYLLANAFIQSTKSILDSYQDVMKLM